MTNKEKRQRLQSLRHMTKEQLMILWYAKQEQRAGSHPTRETEKIFNACKGTSTQKRVKNRFSTEQAGTCSQSTTTRRFATSQTFVEKRGKSVRTYTLTSYTNVVCKSYSNKY